MTDTPEEKVDESTGQETDIPEEKEEVIEPGKGEEKSEDKSEEKADETDYKAEADKWKKSYEEKQKWADAKFEEQRKENESLKTRVPKDEPPKFVKKSVDEELELAVTDKEAYAKYEKEKEQDFIDRIDKTKSEKDAQTRKDEIAVKAYKQLNEDYPDLKKDDSELFKEVNSVLISRGLKMESLRDVEITRDIAEKIALRKELEMTKVEAKKAAVKEVKDKEKENIETKDKGDDSEVVELTPAQERAIKVTGVKRDDYIKTLEADKAKEEK